MAGAVSSILPDLNFIPQTVRGEIIYVVKEMTQGKIYRFGEDEYDLIKLFDGRRSPRQVAESFNGRHTQVEVDAQTVLAFQRRLKSMRLLELSSRERQERLYEIRKERKENALLRGQGSWTYRRYPLIRPDGLLEWMKPFTDHLFKWPFLLFSAFIILTGWTQVILNFDLFIIAMKNLLTFSGGSMSDLALLWCVAFVVVWIHEFGHGICCKRYGGTVKEMGFLLMFFQPYFYADISDAWLFAEKKHKIITVMVGVFVEAFLGGLGAWLWMVSNPESLWNAIGFQAVLICGVSSVALNFNPLIKRDGYYALSDSLEIPNLKSEAGDYCQRLFNKHALAWVEEEDDEGDDYDRRDHMIMGVYGYIAGGYMIFMMSMIYMLFTSFAEMAFGNPAHLLNPIIFYFVFKSYFNRIGGFIKEYLSREGDNKFVKRRRRIKIGVVALLIMCLFPVRIAVSADGVLESVDRQVIRAPESAQLIKLSTGYITSGEPIAIFDNPDLRKKLATTRLELEQLILRRRISLDSGDRAQATAIRLQIKPMKERLRVLEDQISSMQIRAGFDGSLGDPELARLTGSWFGTGQEVGLFSGQGRHAVVVELDELEYVPEIGVGDSVDLLLPSEDGGILSGRVVYVDVGTEIADSGALEKRTVTLRLEAEDPEHVARAGMGVRVRINAGRTVWGMKLLRDGLKFLRLDWIF